MAACAHCEQSLGKKSLKDTFWLETHFKVFSPFSWWKLSSCSRKAACVPDFSSPVFTIIKQDSCHSDYFDGVCMYMSSGLATCCQAHFYKAFVLATHSRVLLHPTVCVYEKEWTSFFFSSLLVLLSCNVSISFGDIFKFCCIILDCRCPFLRAPSGLFFSVAWLELCCSW